jgi:hypothetical protein
MVVGTHGDDVAAPREEAACCDEDDKEGQEDLTDGRTGPSWGSTLERSSMALTSRETGLHLGPHDSIGGVNERMAAIPEVETARRRRL